MKLEKLDSNDEHFSNKFLFPRSLNIQGTDQSNINYFDRRQNWKIVRDLSHIYFKRFVKQYHVFMVLSLSSGIENVIHLQAHLALPIFV